MKYQIQKTSWDVIDASFDSQTLWNIAHFMDRYATLHEFQMI